MYESEFRAFQKANGGPTWGQTTDEILDSLGADVVFEGPQATGGEFWQFSMRQDVEQVDGKWYTKYVLGPIFTDTEEATADEQQLKYIAQKNEERTLAIKNQIIDATQKRLDDFAQTRNYDGILSLCTYATSPNPKFKAEGQYGVEARDSTWAKLYEILEKVTNGTLPKPSGYADIELDLPVLTWP
jgi:hypothetical protein